MEPMATAALTSECPLIPRSCEKISRCPSTCSGRTAKYSNFHMPHPFVVRLSNHERIFSQLPFCKGRIFSGSTQPLFVKEAQGRFLARAIEKLFNEFQIRHTNPGFLRKWCSGRAFRPEPTGLGSPNDPDFNPPRPTVVRKLPCRSNR